MQACFFIPGPPNFGLSRQKSHCPQSLGRRHAAHSMHRTPLLRMTPLLVMSSCLAVGGLGVYSSTTEGEGGEGEESLLVPLLLTSLELMSTIGLGASCENSKNFHKQNSPNREKQF